MIVENAVYEISGLKTLLFIFCLLLPSHLEASSYSNSESIQKEQILDNFSNIPTLQMNPATLEEVTEGVGTLKKELGFSEVSEGSSAGGAVNQAVSSTVIESSPSIRSTLDKTSPSLVSSDPTERVKIEKLQIKVKLERAAKLEEQANQAYVAAKLEEANSWKSAGECLRTSVASMMKAMKARNSENIPLAEYCASEAEKLEQAAELMVEGAQAYAAGNREVGCDWHLAGDCIQKSTKIMRQSREAADAENAVLAESYAIEAEKLEEAATLCIQGAHADLAKKIEEGKSWGLAGLNIRLSSGTMIKAIKARVSGRESLAKNYEIEAKKWEQAAELMKKAAQTYAAGKAAEGSCLFWAGEYISNSAEIMIKAMEAQNSELSAQELLFTSSSDTTRLFRGSVEYEYRLLERAAEFMIRGAQAYAAEKELEGKSWELAGSYTNERLEIMTKAAQAHATRNVSLVESYTEVAKELEKATEFMVQGAEAYAAKKETAGQDWYSAGQYMKGSAETMIKGIGASISGKVILGKSYTAEAKKLEQAAELMKRAAHANAAEKEVEESMLVWAGHLTQESAGTMIKAIEAREAGNASLGERYTLEAKKSERAAELMKQGIQAYGEGTQEKIATSWYWAGHYTQVSAETMLKGIEASISRKGLLEKNYTTEAKKSEQAAKLMKKAAKAYAAGNEREGSMWERTGELTQTSAKTMIKAIQARVGENISLAESYATEAKKLEQAAELTIQIAQTYVAEKKFEGNIWYQAQYIQASAEMMLQAIKMRTSGDSSLADSYTAEAKKLEEAATLMKKAVQAYAAGRELEGNSWSFASQYMQESAKIMLQAIETRITEDTSLIESYVVEAHKLEQVAGLYIQGAQAYSVREEEE
ncbi:MAG TPA: hypothetical protein VJK54_08675, partial [Chthoniobacterales bacterium]|nr:hypothetical protein [Chthoniobacterales bacterium]